MKTIAKIGISAISAAAVAGAGYLGKKFYDKKKHKTNKDESIENPIDEVTESANETEVSTTEAN